MDWKKTLTGLMLAALLASLASATMAEDYCDNENMVLNSSWFTNMVVWSEYGNGTILVNTFNQSDFDPANATCAAICSGGPADFRSFNGSSYDIYASDENGTIIVDYAGRYVTSKCVPAVNELGTLRGEDNRIDAIKLVFKDGSTMYPTRVSFEYRLQNDSVDWENPVRHTEYTLGAPDGLYANMGTNLAGNGNLYSLITWDFCPQPTTTFTFPEYNMTPINATTFAEHTECMTWLLNGSIKKALKCLYIGENFYRDTNVPTMGYFFYLIVFGGMTFIFYLKHRSIPVAGMMMLFFLAVFGGEFPPEAGIIYWGTVIAAIVSTLYGLFKNDD